jgi:hypothetical protein
VGIYFRGLGFIFWIIGVVGSLAYYDTIQAYGIYAYIVWMVVTVLIGLFFIAFGEMMILLQQNLEQNQALYNLLKDWEGENR